MPDFLNNFSLDNISFGVGFLSGMLFLWIMGRLIPIIRHTWRDWRTNRQETRSSMSSKTEAYYRFDTLRLAQRLHMASPLFPLDEIVVAPRLQAPPMQVEPGQELEVEDITTLTIPYMPDWPEFAAVYHARTLSLTQVLNQGLNLILMGNPGSGKTVCLAQLASQIARRDPAIGELSDFLPVLAHISDILPNGKCTDNPLEALIQAVCSQASKTSLPRLAELLQEELDAGNVLLLLDGLDESPPPLHTEGINFLSKLIERYPRTRIVVSSSPNDISGLTPLGLVPVALASWDKPTRHHFIHQWGDRWLSSRTPAQESGDEPIDQHLMDAWLGGSSDFLSPLELTLKVWSAYAGDALGAGPREAIQSYYDRITAGIPDARPALEALAFHLISNLRISLPEKEEQMGSDEILLSNETDSISKPVFKEKSDLSKGDQEFRKVLSGYLADLVDTGLVTLRNNNSLAFPQPVIAGTLAARAVKTLDDENQILNQPEWSGKDALLATLAADSDLGSLIDTLKIPIKDPRNHRILKFARWLPVTPKKSPWRTIVLRSLASILADESQPLGLRARAICALVQSGDPGVKKLLDQMLITTSESQRFLAILGLGFIRDEQAVPQLSNLLDETSPSIGRAVCLALAAIGNKSAIESLAWALLNSGETVRQAAAEALAHIPEEGYPILEEGSQMDNLLVRRAVIFGLVQVRQPRAIQILEKLAIEDKEWVVRTTATHALDQLKSPEVHIPHGLPALSESAWLISYAGEHGLGVSPGKPAEDLLRKALRDGTDDQKLAALDYLRLNGGETDLPFILEVQQKFPGDLREAAFNTIWHLGAAGLISI